MIAIEKIKKSYKIDSDKHEEVLKSLDMTLNPGVNVILGPSGCGKSTLLNIISGLDNDYDGNICINGENIRNINSDLYHQRDIGFIFQNFNLLNNLTLLDNILVSLKVNKTMNKNEKKEHALNLLNKVGLKTFANKFPTQLSGGQKQRVAIARSLANNPNIIIADEPTGALDSKSSIQILEILKSLANEGKILLVVTHDPLLKEFADQIYTLSDGIVVTHEIINDTQNIKFQEKKEKLVSLTIPNIISFSKNNFRSRLLRNILVSLGTSIGIIGILLSLGLGTGIDNGVEEIFSSIISPNAINVTVVNEGAVTAGPPTVTFNEQEIIDSIEIIENEGLQEYYLDTYYNAVEINYDDYSTIITLNKLDFDEERQSSFSVENETLLVGNEISDNEPGIYITQELASELLGLDSVNDLTTESAQKLIDEDVNLSLTFRDDITTEIYDIKVPIIGITTETNFSTLVYGSAKLFEDIKELTNEDPEILSITAYADNPNEAQEISEKYKNLDNFSISTLGDVLGQIGQFTAAISITLAFVAGLSLIVAAVMIAIVLYIGVIERKKEIGILRALGFRKKNVRSIFLFEAIYISIVANVIAIMISLIIEISLNPTVAEITGFTKPIDISLLQIFIIFGLTTLIAIIAGLYPSNKAASVDPIISLKDE